VRNAPEGIDVSDNNGPHFDWESWKGHIEFAMCKATEGDTFLDPVFPENWKGMHQIGVRRFAYHFARPAESDPHVQALMFTKVVRAQGLEKGDHFVLDLEDSGGLHPLQVSFWAYVFRQEMFRLNPGHRCLVYTFRDFAEQGYCAKLGNSELWIAQFDTPQPTMPVGPWKRAAFWQDTGTGLDRDVFMLGDVKALESFCAT
jgi:GH25 family lysozyme M1 (1,4-beta-N-acetylmuramidase)